MRDMLVIKNGMVAAREIRALTNEEREAIAATATSEADRLEANKAAAEATVFITSNRIASDPNLARAYRRDVVEQKIAESREVAAHFSAPDPRPMVEADVYQESAAGGPLLWPRAYRDALLTATDYVDVPGWRLSKSAEVLAAADAYRAALRGLPAAYPDPIAVVWPVKPVGV